MDIQKYVSDLNRDGIGLWLSAEHSAELLDDASILVPNLSLSGHVPPPSLYYVRYSDDTEDWRSLLRVLPNVVPYIECAVDSMKTYPLVDAWLKQCGARLTVLVVNPEWQHEQAALDSMLTLLNTEENPIAVMNLSDVDADAWASIMSKFPSVYFDTLPVQPDDTTLAEWAALEHRPPLPENIILTPAEQATINAALPGGVTIASLLATTASASTVQPTP